MNNFARLHGINSKIRATCKREGETMVFRTMLSVGRSRQGLIAFITLFYDAQQVLMGLEPRLLDCPGYKVHESHYFLKGISTGARSLTALCVGREAEIVQIQYCGVNWPKISKKQTLQIHNAFKTLCTVKQDAH